MAELGFIKDSHYHKIKFYANSRLILLTLLLELHRTGSGQSVVFHRLVFPVLRLHTKFSRSFFRWVDRAQVGRKYINKIVQDSEFI